MPRLDEDLWANDVRPNGTTGSPDITIYHPVIQDRFKAGLTADPQDTATAFVLGTVDPAKVVQDMADNHLTCYIVQERHEYHTH